MSKKQPHCKAEKSKFVVSTGVDFEKNINSLIRKKVIFTLVQLYVDKTCTALFWCWAIEEYCRRYFVAL